MENFTLFNYERDINSKAYKYVYAHWNEFLSKFIAVKYYTVYGKMAKIAMQNDSDMLCYKASLNIKPALAKDDTVLFKQAKNIAMQSKYDNSKYVVCMDEIPYYKIKGRWEEYLKETDAYLAKYGAERPDLYNSFAWNIYDNTDNNTALQKSLEYVQTSIKSSKVYENTDTYAHVLYKLKRYDEALKAANEAIDMAKANNQDSGTTADLVKDIQKSMDSKSKN
jgi:tetratricopeptide (TPR) repeat protein